MLAPMAVNLAQPLYARPISVGRSESDAGAMINSTLVIAKHFAPVAAANNDRAAGPR